MEPASLDIVVDDHQRVRPGSGEVPVLRVDDLAVRFRARGRRRAVVHAVAEVSLAIGTARR